MNNNPNPASPPSVLDVVELARELLRAWQASAHDGDHTLYAFMHHHVRTLATDPDHAARLITGLGALLATFLETAADDTTSPEDLLDAMALGTMQN